MAYLIRQNNSGALFVKVAPDKVDAFEGAMIKLGYESSCYDEASCELLRYGNKNNEDTKADIKAASKESNGALL